jgi:ubiquinone biosynthesis protein
MEVQPSLILLQKTLLNIEGLGRQLYPELNLWDTAQPYLERWVQDRYSPQSMIKRIQRQAPSWLEQLPQLPEAVMGSLQHSRNLEQESKRQRESISALQSHIGKRQRRRRYHGLAAIFLLLAIVSAMPQGLPGLTTIPLSSWILAGLALILYWRSGGGD